MRKILLLFVAILAFCLVSSGGCGSDDDDSGSAPEAVPSSWSELSNQYKPVAGSFTIYEGGNAYAEYSLNATSSAGVYMTIRGSNDPFTITLEGSGDGTIIFNLENQVPEAQTVTHNYTMYATDENYHPSGGKLSTGDFVRSGVTWNYTLQYIDDTTIKLYVVRKSGTTISRSTEITFERE